MDNQTKGRTMLGFANAHVADMIAIMIGEIERQDRKWGAQDHGAHDWTAIILEEFGETAKALNEADRAAYVKELIETAACCIQAAANAQTRFIGGGEAANTTKG